MSSTVHGGGVFRYPSVYGTIHVDEPLDEISLVRLVRAMEALNFHPKEITSATFGETLVSLAVIDPNSPARPRWYSVAVP